MGVVKLPAGFAWMALTGAWVTDETAGVRLSRSWLQRPRPVLPRRQVASGRATGCRRLRLSGQVRAKKNGTLPLPLSLPPIPNGTGGRA